MSMRLAYYKRADGTVRYFHGVDKVDPEILQERVAAYNIASAKGTGETAHIVEYADDSFEAYLFRRATEHMRLSLETLRDMKDAINHADDVICDLIAQAELIERGESE